MPRYEFDTREFEISHGRPPRGRGSWAFSFRRRYQDVTTEVVFAPPSTYAEARRWITDQARRCAVPDGTVIYVQP